MIDVKNDIIARAEKLNIKIVGLEDVPVILQGRPLFDFVGADEALLKSVGQNEDDLFEGEGLHNIAVFGDGRVEGLKTVSSQYQVVQHYDAILNVFSSLPDEFDLNGIEISVTPNGGKCFAKFNSGNTIEIKPGDDIMYQLLMENSGDTSTRFSLSGGAWRLICSNGMKIPDNRIEMVTQKKLHKGDLNLDGEILEFLSIMNESIDAMGIWKGYTDTKIGIPQLEEVFEMLSVGPRTQEEILNLELRGENTSLQYLLDNKKLTAWDTYNAFTQRITDSESSETVKIENGNKVSNAFDRLIMK